MRPGRILKDIKSFIAARDLAMLAITIALSNQFQQTTKTIIDTMIMPFVSRVTGATNLKSRAIDLQTPKGKSLGIQLGWGAAVESVIVFIITLVVMVQMARYFTKLVKSPTVSFDS